MTPELCAGGGGLIFAQDGRADESESGSQRLNSALVVSVEFDNAHSWHSHPNDMAGGSKLRAVCSVRLRSPEHVPLS